MANTGTIENLTRDIELKRKRAGFMNFTFISGFAGPFVTVVTLAILAMANNIEISKVASWMMFITFIPTITLSLVVSQRKQLVGAYGETILILIPTFVWLLAGHSNSIKWLLIMALGIIIIGLFSYVFGVFMKSKDTVKNKKLRQLLIRIGFVSAAVVSTVAVSVILLDWADGAVELAPTRHGVKDYTATSWIMFIAIVTIMDAMLLVVLGLVSHYNIQRSPKVKPTNTKKASMIGKTQVISLKPNKHKKTKLKKYVKKKKWGN